MEWLSITRQNAKRSVRYYCRIETFAANRAESFQIDTSAKSELRHPTQRYARLRMCHLSPDCNTYID